MVYRYARAISCSQTCLALDINAKRRALAIAIDHGVAELRQRTAAMQAYQEDEYRDKVIQWLHTTDPSSNHRAACGKHQPSTGDWFIKGPDMEEWKRTRGSLIWLYGIR
jgi:hypothetical protein